jgi:hypothetical protein
MTTAMTGAWYSTVLTTDAREQEFFPPQSLNNVIHNPWPYNYTDEP